MLEGKDLFVIGLHGIIGSGKGEVANFLSKKLKFKVLSFADPIRLVCSSIFGFSQEQMTDRVLKETVDERWGIAPRDAFRIIGHGFREQIRDDIWIIKLRNKIKNLSCVQISKFLIVIDDVRYQNEVDFIEKELNGHVLHINRVDNPYQTIATHASDLQQLNISYTINNDSNIEALKTSILFALNDFDFFNKEHFNEMLQIINKRG